MHTASDSTLTRHRPPLAYYTRWCSGCRFSWLIRHPHDPADAWRHVAPSEEG